ncbi:MAG: XrtA system polysaccharide chain length determinant [Pseudomonadota bacterium]
MGRFVFRLESLPAPVVRHLNGLWKRRWAVAIAAWAAALLGWFGLWLIPDKYESRAQVYVQTETILQPVLNGVTAAPDYRSRVEVMRLQLLTRPNVEEIIYRSGLDQTIEAKGEVDRLKEMQGLIERVAETISIESPRDLYFVITYRNADPVIAKKVTDAVLTLLIEQDLGASLSESDSARRRLNLQIEQFEERLTANEEAVASFRREHAVELAASEGTTRRRDQKDQELLRTADEIAKTRGRILTLQNLLSATPRVASGGEIERLRVELADLRSKYNDTHPDIRGLEARLKELGRHDSGLASNPDYVRLGSELRVAEDSLANLEDREADLRAEVNALDLAVGQAPAVLAELAQIERQYDTTKKTYEDLLARRDRLQLTQSLGPAGRGVEYQVFERPVRALKPAFPPRGLLIAFVGVLALGAGAGVGIGLNALDRSYAQADELEAAFGLPVLGAIAEAPSAAVSAFRRREILRLACAGGALILVGAVYGALTLSTVSPESLREAAAGETFRGDRL